MQELTTNANLVDYATLEGRDSFTTVISRSELEAALRADDPAGLWFEFGREEEEEELRQLTIQLGPAEIEEMLRLAKEDEVVFAIAADPVVSLFDEPEVEAHGLRSALAIAVVAGAVAAPASLAATPQTTSAAATAQQANPAASVQQVSAAAAPQRASVAARVQVANPAAKAQLSKRLVLKAAGLKTLGRGRS
jgi:hypothetical protein